MSYCFNPHCQKSENPNNTDTCINCGSTLLLKQRYRAIKSIGQGGFGRTLLAVDESQTLKPACVIKQFIFQSQSVDNSQKAAELFQQEALRLENLGQHNQIPNLLDYLTQDEYQYLVQEYIDGYNLADILIEQGTFKEKQIWELLNSLLPVLEFIHQNDVIHRDIKPQNIIRGKDGKLYLVDFGAAKLVTGTAILRTGTSIGTPEFVAPEQSRGKANYSSDLYSLGATCIYLLTGISTFDLFDIYENTWVWKQYLVDNTISEQLAHILDKLIENAISRRYQSVNEVLADINLQKIISYPINQLIQSFNPPWKCINTFIGHTNSINSIALSPDGKLLASGSNDCMVKLWETNTGKEVWNLYNQTSIHAVTYSCSRDGLMFASGDSGKYIQVWDANRNKKNIEGHTGWFGRINDLSFSPDNKILASAGSDKKIRLWDVNTGIEINTLEGHKRWINSIAISPDGNFIASGSTDKTAIVWDLNTGIKLQQLQHKGLFAGVNSVTFSPDGQTIATASEDCTIKFWEVTTGKIICVFRGHDFGVRCVTFNPILDIFASGSYDGTIKLWNIKKRAVISTLIDHKYPVNSIVFSTDGKVLFSGSDDNTIKVWQYE